MITAALVAYLKANLSNSRVFVGEVPQGTQLPAITIDDNGDTPQRYWDSGVTVTGYCEQEFEISTWAANPGGAYNAKVLADEIRTLLDNFAGPMTDTAASPNVVHRVLFIDAENGGDDFSQAPEIYSHSILLAVTYCG